jgi:flavin reductase (DIM6/NTAB) family NADH-FMN oxidoreductase RutF
MRGSASRPSPIGQAASPRLFMGGFPSGISVVTALDPGAGPHGMTCSSLARVTLTPPTIVVSMRSMSPTLAAALAHGQFAVNLLHEGARAVADLFASGAPDRFEHVKWRLPIGAAGPHLIADAHAIADCVIVQAVEVGDHSAVFAEVIRVAVEDTAEPLLYGRHRYARWSDAASVPPPPSRDPAESR